MRGIINQLQVKTHKILKHSSGYHEDLHLDKEHKIEGQNLQGTTYTYISVSLWMKSWKERWNESYCPILLISDLFVVVQLLSHVRLLATPWTTAHQASLSFTISRSLLKLMSIDLVMPCNHLILCHPLLLLPYDWLLLYNSIIITKTCSLVG